MQDKENNKLYIAIKLIEILYKEGKITKTIFKNILNEYSDRIDITSFQC